MASSYHRCAGGGGIREFKVSTNFVRLSNFERTASNVFRSTSSCPSSLASIEKPTILVSGSANRSADAVSTPFDCGIPMSRRTNSQQNSLAFSTAPNPSPTSSQTLRRVVASTNCRIAPRTAALSSAIRIQGLGGVGMPMLRLRMVPTSGQ